MDCNYTFKINLAPNGIPCGFKSGGQPTIRLRKKNKKPNLTFKPWANCPWANCPWANCPWANCPGRIVRGRIV